MGKLSFFGTYKIKITHRKRFQLLLENMITRIGLAGRRKWNFERL
jgi:hypothetical protein